MDPRERSRRSLRRISALYGILALLVIPLYTVLYACRADLITQNMTHVGSARGGYRELVLWGLLSGGFYLGFILWLFRLTRYANGRVRRMLFVGCALLVLTVLLPFVPELWPRAAWLHGFTALAAPIIMILVLYFFVFHLARCDRRVFRRALLWLTGLTALSAALLFATGTSGLLEVVTTVGMCLYLFMLLIWLTQSPHFDPPEDEGR